MFTPVEGLGYWQLPVGHASPRPVEDQLPQQRQWGYMLMVRAKQDAGHHQRGQHGQKVAGDREHLPH